jgi:hypothetical protein
MHATCPVQHILLVLKTQTISGEYLTENSEKNRSNVGGIAGICFSYSAGIKSELTHVMFFYHCIFASSLQLIFHLFKLLFF